MRRSNLFEFGNSQEQFVVPNLHSTISDFFTDKKNLQKGARILDVGCGNQPFRALIESLGFEYYSFDLSLNKRSDIDYVGSISEALPEELENQKYDCVLCSEVLEHVFNWEKSFENFANLLLPEGKLIVSIPFVYLIHEAPHDYWRPTPYAVLRACSDNSLHVIEHRKLGDFTDLLGLLMFSSFPDGIKERTLKNRIKFRIVNWMFLKVRKLLTKESILKIVTWNSQYNVSNFFVIGHEK